MITLTHARRRTNSSAGVGAVAPAARRPRRHRARGRGAAGAAADDCRRCSLGATAPHSGSKVHSAGQHPLLRSGQQGGGGGGGPRRRRRAAVQAGGRGRPDGAPHNKRIQASRADRRRRGHARRSQNVTSSSRPLIARDTSPLCCLARAATPRPSGPAAPAARSRTRRRRAPSPRGAGRPRTRPTRAAPRARSTPPRLAPPATASTRSECRPDAARSRPRRVFPSPRSLARRAASALSLRAPPGAQTAALGANLGCRHARRAITRALRPPPSAARCPAAHPNPPPPPAAPRTPYVTGTSVLGLTFAGGVLLAADTLGSYGSTKRYKSFERLLKVNDAVIVAAGGELSDFQYIAR